MSSVPVSQYEALRAEMRCLVQQAQQVQEIATQVISTTSSASTLSTIHQSCQDDLQCRNKNQVLNFTMESLVLENTPLTNTNKIQYELSTEVETTTSEDECGRVSSSQISVSSEPITNGTKQVSNLYHGTWPVERTMWNSEPTKAHPNNIQANMNHNVDQVSVLSFASSSGGAPLDRVLGSPEHLSRRSMQQLEAKVDMVYSLLSMLGGQEHADMGDTLLALSTSPESCLALRQSGCIPLLVQLVQSDKDLDTRKKASKALHNLIHAQPDEKLKKREIRVLKLLELVRSYNEALKNNTEFEHEISSSSENQENGDSDKHPVSTVANLMKHSFDEGHRQAICQLGGIHIIASLVEVEHTLHGSTTDLPTCILLRRYACMALTNLTFGDSGNKALLCSFRDFMRALVIQLQSPSDELRQVTASVLRNLSWRADQTSKEILREVGTVTGLMKASMATNKENTLKSILSALWNLSAHCTENKLEICAVENGLGFLVDMLSYKAPSKSLTINENAGGILRNISSQIAVREDYREILRKHNCLQILLEQLKSPSLTIVSNACGTLWNLSAKNQVDQEALWQMGAPAMLRSLNHSKHKMIATGSSAALKNLLNSRPSHSLIQTTDSTARSMDLPSLPTLGARKQKALLRDLDQNLAETFENIDSPTKSSSVDEKMVLARTEKYKDDDTLAFDNSNEASTSYNMRNKNRTPQYYGNPNVFLNSSSNPSRRKGTFIPVRNNYTDSYSDEVTDQPIDYSRKFSEPTKSYEQNPSSNQKIANYGFSRGPGRKKSNGGGNYGIYAETDLDQPTDYSLRYAEDDSDSDICDKKCEYVSDSVKTYCTEGTPYETPINFSTSTSMSDLREPDKNEIDNDKGKRKVESSSKAPNLSHLDEKDHCSTEDISDSEKKQEPTELCSGLASPEKPVNYCEEGTPGYFSRVSSFSSLNGIEGKEKGSKDGSTEEQKERESEKKVEPTLLESKPVPVLNCAEQTPLMFSRSSSLGSLDSAEQHSIHDDRSSIVSDFSRLTSGIVSPSELPDSPTQTVPPSPRPRKINGEYQSTSRGNSRVVSRPQPAPRTLQKLSVFEDNVTKFKEESTPIQFSTATSISSLTIDDQDEPICGDLRVINNGLSTNVAVDVKEEGLEKQDVEREKLNNSSEFDEKLSDNEDDEDILADCISIGMQNNRHRHSKTASPPVSKIPSPLSYKVSGRAHGSGIPVPRSSIPQYASKPKPITNIDSVRTYCTEDTPAVLSQAGSNSDLSVLSVQTDNKSKRDYLSDDSSNLSGDNDSILAECIQSGMPKAKQPKEKCQIPTLNNQTVPSTSTPIKSNLQIDKRSDNQLRKLYLENKDEVSTFAVENSPCQFSLRSSLSDLTADSSVAGLIRCMGEGETKSSPGASKPNQDPQKNLSRQESLSSLSVESFGSVEADQALLEQCISSGMPKSRHNVTPNKSTEKPKPIGIATKQSNLQKNLKRNEKENEISLPKNVNATSVAANTKQISLEEMKAVTDVRGEKIEAVPTMCIEENSSIDPMKNGCDLFKKSIDNRMLDPAAMIESLDRFTAELVSQASHLQNEHKYNTASITEGGNTWNEDNSSNDVTFPSISGSVPNVITFPTENSNQVDHVDGVLSPQESNDFSSINTSTLTESTLIAIEATKMATTFKQEAEMSTSINSLASLELDQVQPPSQMNSLIGSGFEAHKKSPKIVRKRSLPSGLLVRRALSNSLNQASSIESLEPHSLSNLDQINPPSIMNGLIDMDGSMLSVASLKSESEDLRPEKKLILVQPMANSANYSSLTDLNNVNPPSLFNEITDMCNSLADLTSNNIETEVFEDCCTLLTENDASEFSDAQSVTPLQSDVSSADSTPKKKSLNKHLTPKQRRQLAKERYKTYTVAAEMVTCSENAGDDDYSLTEDFKTVACDTESYKTVCENYSTATYTRSPKKSSKERRLGDADRYKTQVLDKNVSDISLPKETDVNRNSTPSPQRSRIGIRKNFVQKRLENRERFKTQVISNENACATSISSQDLHDLVQKEANAVLKTLSETKSRPDELLDCETLSLVSNEDESEHNLNYKTYHKSWGNASALPVAKNSEENPCSLEVENSHPLTESSDDSLEEVEVKPKIVKPSEKMETMGEPEAQGKGIRGKRKPLYSLNKLPAKPATSSKTVNSNLVKNVSSTLKSTVPKSKIATKPPPGPAAQTKHIPKTNAIKTTPSTKSSPTHTKTSPQRSPGPNKSPLERQGTFTKEDRPAKSKIPSALPKAATFTSRIAKAITPTSKSTKTELPSKLATRTFTRSTSVDSRDRILRNNSAKNSTVKRPLSETSQRSSSASSIATNPSSKQITSRIASLWKKVEESKKQPQKKDTRVWIQNKPSEEAGNSQAFETNAEESKRASRLDSFIDLEDEKVALNSNQYDHNYQEEDLSF